MEYIVVLTRTIFYYAIINVIYRILGKREIGELSVMDLVTSFLLTELAAMSIDKYRENIFMSLLPMFMLVLIEIITSRLILKNNKIRDILEGNPSVIINKGKINFKEMLRCRYNISDLLTELRKSGIKSIEDVSYAVLETTGNLSVFTKDGMKYGDYPLPLILDGEIQELTLKEINKNRKWVLKTLDNKNIKLEDVFYGFYHDEKIFIIKEEYKN